MPAPKFYQDVLNGLYASELVGLMDRQGEYIGNLEERDRYAYMRKKVTEQHTEEELNAHIKAQARGKYNAQRAKEVPLLQGMQTVAHAADQLTYVAADITSFQTSLGTDQAADPTEPQIRKAIQLAMKPYETRIRRKMGELDKTALLDNLLAGGLGEAEINRRVEEINRDANVSIDAARVFALATEIRQAQAGEGARDLLVAAVPAPLTPEQRTAYQNRLNAYLEECTNAAVAYQSEAIRQILAIVEINNHVKERLKLAKRPAASGGRPLDGNAMKTLAEELTQQLGAHLNGNPDAAFNREFANAQQIHTSQIHEDFRLARHLEFSPKDRTHIQVDPTGQTARRNLAAVNQRSNQTFVFEGVKPPMTIEYIDGVYRVNEADLKEPSMVSKLLGRFSKKTPEQEISSNVSRVAMAMYAIQQIHNDLISPGQRLNNVAITGNPDYLADSMAGMQILQVSVVNRGDVKPEAMQKHTAEMTQTYENLKVREDSALVAKVEQAKGAKAQAETAAKRAKFDAAVTELRAKIAEVEKDLNSKDKDANGHFIGLKHIVGEQGSLTQDLALFTKTSADDAPNVCYTYRGYVRSLVQLPMLGAVLTEAQQKLAALEGKIVGLNALIANLNNPDNGLNTVNPQLLQELTMQKEALVRQYQDYQTRLNPGDDPEEDDYTNESELCKRVRELSAPDTWFNCNQFNNPHKLAAYQLQADIDREEQRAGRPPRPSVLHGEQVAPRPAAGGPVNASHVAVAPLSLDAIDRSDRNTIIRMRGNNPPPAAPAPRSPLS